MTGLRERKKQQTRELIAETALQLFLERGFDGVTVAEVAQAADVAQKTVFNYFPTKEDLFYWRLESFEAELLDAVRDRRPGEPVLAAFGRFVLEPRGLLAKQDPAARERLTAITRMIAESPALLAREQQIFARYTASLAAVLTEETGGRADDVEPWVVANALMGVHRAMVAYSRRRIASGASGPRLGREVRAQGRRALAALEEGLGGYPMTDSRLTG
jgi:AcrR family transcriptional regulator